MSNSDVSRAGGPVERDIEQVRFLEFNECGSGPFELLSVESCNLFSRSTVPLFCYFC